MMTNEITAIAGSNKKRKRIGRGKGSGHGKTSGRGQVFLMSRLLISQGSWKHPTGSNPWSEANVQSVIPWNSFLMNVQRILFQTVFLKKRLNWCRRKGLILPTSRSMNYIILFVGKHSRYFPILSKPQRLLVRHMCWLGKQPFMRKHWQKAWRLLIMW